MADEEGAPIVRKLTRPPLLDLSSTGGPSVPFCAHRRCASSVEEEGTGETGWAALSRRGRMRATREDKYCMHPFFANNGGPVSLFGVFDGHGGDAMSRYAALRMPLLFASYLEDDVGIALRKSFLTTHSELVQRFAGGWDGGEKTVEQGEPAEQAEQLEPALERSWTALPSGDTGGKVGSSTGTTATAVAICAGSLVIAHAGDSRALIALSNGGTRRLCEDHRPTREDELNRISNAGGLVVCVGGAPRVNGVMAVTRALGHADFAGLVIPEPEVRTEALQGDEKFLVIGSDGIWDHVNDEECTDVVSAHMDGEGGARAAVRALVQRAWDSGGNDDITAVVVNLARYRGEEEMYEDSASGDEQTENGERLGDEM